jgi:ribose-phosphate pyrophosphokinase
MIEPFSILSTRSCLSYAKQVVDTINSLPERILFPDVIDYTEALAVTVFADGEMEVILQKSVRARRVFLFTTCARNEAGLSVEECKIELYHTIDVLKRSQSSEIIIFEPYISCSRSDRTTRRNSVGMWIHYKTMISLGANHLLTYQLHSDKIKTVFDPCLCSVDDVHAVSLLQKYLCETAIKNTSILHTEVKNDWLFCSVDAGGEKLARKFATAFGTQLVIAQKQRNYLIPNTIDSINLLSAVPLENKNVWIVDDMIDTGGSVYGLAKELKKRTQKEIHIMIVHPVLSGPAIDRLIELKNEGTLGRLVVCDTVSCESLKSKLPFMEIIGSACLSGKIILTIVQNHQMSDLIDSFSPIEFLKTTGS